MNPWGGNVAGYGETQNRAENVNQGQARPGQARTVKCYNCNVYPGGKNYARKGVVRSSQVDMDLVRRSRGEMFKLIASLIVKRELEQPQVRCLFSSTVKINRLYDFEEILKLLVWVS
nr:hypothetical protein [Tanacetum cinerariifolium]